MSNIVAIIGRPNVGKSTLFNRLTQSKDAIVDLHSGVTRDRNYGSCEWNGVEFSIIDTGGYIDNSDDIFEKEIQFQVKTAIEEATLLLMVVDVSAGITYLDEKVAHLIKRSSKSIVLAVNKVDNHLRQNDIYEFYKLGIDDGEIFPIASASGSGTGDLLDYIVSKMPLENSKESSNIPKIAIVGRPNVGKSSLLNAITGEHRNIVTDIAGTTRDSISVRYNSFGLEFDIIDTAGIRKKTKVHEDLEFYSVIRSIKSIEEADVCMIMIEADQGLVSQDLSIISIAIEKRKGIVLVVNKWDLIEEKETNTMKELTNTILEKLSPFNDLPIIFTSITNNKQRILKALQTTLDVFENKKRKISTSKLNDYLLAQIKHFPPPATKGKWVKIKYITQLPNQAPTFIFFCNLPQYIKTPYKRFLENKLREVYNFSGVPIQMFFRKK